MAVKLVVKRFKFLLWESSSPVLLPDNTVDSRIAFVDYYRCKTGDEFIGYRWFVKL